MQHTSEVSTLLEQINASDALTDYIDPKRLTRRVSFIDLELFLAEHGYKIERQDGNVYGFMMIVKTDPQAMPAFRLITRSDHAAVYGSRGR